MKLTLQIDADDIHDYIIDVIEDFVSKYDPSAVTITIEVQGDEYSALPLLPEEA